MHDGDVAGQQVGKLCEEKRRAELRRQLFVQKDLTIGACL